MMRTITALCFLVCALGAAAQNRGLAVGDAAPPLEVAQWLYGEPIGGYEPGRLYLIEFTILGCIPCREAIPHLTALATRYRDGLDVVSIYCDGEKYAPNVLALQKRLDTLMQYAIAMDDPHAPMNRRWRSEGDTGFPRAFLVDGQGRIAWQGLVRTKEIDTVIQATLVHRFDAADHERREAAFKAEYLPLVRLRKDEITKTAVTQAEALLPRYPEKEIEIEHLKFNLLLELDAARASRHLAGMLARYPDFSFNPETRFVLYRYPGLDWRLGIELIDRCRKRAVEPGYHAIYLDLKSRIYAYNGAFPEALVAIDEAISIRERAFGAGDGSIGRYRDVRGAYRFCLLAQDNPMAADRWLREQVAAGTLTRDTAGLLYYQLNDRLTEVQREVVARVIGTMGGN